MKSQQMVSFNKTACAICAECYDLTKSISYKQRLSLTLGQKQRQRPAKDWTAKVLPQTVGGYLVEETTMAVA